MYRHQIYKYTGTELQLSSLHYYCHYWLYPADLIWEMGGYSDPDNYDENLSLISDIAAGLNTYF